MLEWILFIIPNFLEILLIRYMEVTCEGHLKPLTTQSGFLLPSSLKYETL